MKTKGIIKSLLVAAIATPLSIAGLQAQPVVTGGPSTSSHKVTEAERYAEMSKEFEEAVGSFRSEIQNQAKAKKAGEEVNVDAISASLEAVMKKLEPMLVSYEKAQLEAEADSNMVKGIAIGSAALSGSVGATWIIHKWANQPKRGSLKLVTIGGALLAGSMILMDLGWYGRIEAEHREALVQKITETERLLTELARADLYVVENGGESVISCFDATSRLMDRLQEIKEEEGIE